MADDRKRRSTGLLPRDLRQKLRKREMKAVAESIREEFSSRIKKAQDRKERKALQEQMNEQIEIALQPYREAEQKDSESCL